MKNIPRTSLCWLQNNLRLADNRALRAAADSDHLLPVFFHNSHAIGAASKCWLHHSLIDLKTNLQKKGSDLICFSGNPLEALENIHKKHPISTIEYSLSCLPGEESNLKPISAWANKQNIQLHIHQDAYLNGPEDILKSDGSPYLVFTAFWNAFLKYSGPTVSYNAPKMPPIFFGN